MAYGRTGALKSAGGAQTSDPKGVIVNRLANTRIGKTGPGIAAEPPQDTTAYDPSGSPVSVPESMPVQQWQPDTLYAGQNYFEAPPGQNEAPQPAGGSSSIDSAAPASSGRAMLPPSPAPAPAPTALQAAYSQFLGSPTPAPPVSPTVDLSPVTGLLQQMSSRADADRVQQDAQRESMRALLRGRMAEASAPVDANAPGIREQLAAQRLARQRSAERQRSQAAVRLSGENLSDSGAFDTAMTGIEELRGAGESADIAEVMGGELQAKRQELMQLYQMALAQGDAEAARTLQQQLKVLEGTVATQGMSEDRRRFSETQNTNQSNFMNNLGLQLLLAQG